MRAAEFEDEGGSAPSSFSRWLVPALLLSLLLHGYFWFWSRGFALNQTSEAYYERVVPRTFHLERANIDEKLLEPDPAGEKHSALAPEAVALPDEKVAFEKLMSENKGEPAAPKIDQVVLSEKPTATATSLDQAMETARRSGAQSVLEDSQSLQQALLDVKPESGGRALSDLLAPEALTGRAIVKAGPLRGGDTPGFSNLDDLLAQTGPLTAETAPILMPTDLLFEFGEYSLSSRAQAGLGKLGLLIQRNPQSVFLIEGHTDSIGTEESNLILSQDRATMVKMWLVREMKIPADRIETVGFGASRLIAPASGTQEEQQINRRVEIVIRPKS